MSCNCKKAEGFDLVMMNAKIYENQTGKKAAVFIVNKTTPSFTDLKNIKKVDGICCYFTTDAIEHEIVKPLSRKTKK